MKRYLYMPDATHSYDAEVVKVTTFPDGETSIMIPVGSMRDDEITLIGSCHSAQASESFLAAAYEIAAQGPKSFTVFNTYFRHARSERSTDGCAALAKFQARQWSGLGRVYPGVRLDFVELHKDTVLHYFEGAVVTNNRTCRELLETYIPYLNDETVFATVDEGGVYEAKKLAQKAGVGFAHIEKKRLSGSETKVLKVLGDDVAGKKVIIFDDMIATGGSACAAAQAYRERGATSVVLAATHGIFAGDAISALSQNYLIDTVFVTDSHPNAELAEDSNPTLIKVIPLNW